MHLTGVYLYNMAEIYNFSGGANNEVKFWNNTYNVIHLIGIYLYIMVEMYNFGVKY